MHFEIWRANSHYQTSCVPTYIKALQWIGQVFRTAASSNRVGAGGLIRMDGKIIFAASTKPFPWVIVWSPLLGSGIAGVVLMLSAFGRTRRSGAARTITWLALCVGIASAIYFPLLWFQHRRHITSQLAHGNFEWVQGVISNFQPESRDRAQNESFSISSHVFSYSSQSFITPCFNQTTVQHGPLHEGMLLKIKYSGDCILRLEELSPSQKPEK